MLRATELRIGNYINYNSNYRFDGVFDEEFARYLFDVKDEWQYLEPILLTEEWLLKFGLKGLPGFYQVGPLLGIWYEKDGELRLSVEDDHINIKYVHQLQNLYWCLCGKELQLKDTITTK